MTAITTKSVVDEINAPSTKYAPGAYAAVLADLAKSGKKTLGYERVEERFPGVKPQHVAHMLKQLKPADAEIVIDANHGVCVLKNA